MTARLLGGVAALALAGAFVAGYGAVAQPEPAGTAAGPAPRTLEWTATLAR